MIVYLDNKDCLKHIHIDPYQDNTSFDLDNPGVPCNKRDLDMYMHNKVEKKTWWFLIFLG